MYLMNSFPDTVEIEMEDFNQYLLGTFNFCPDRSTRIIRPCFHRAINENFHVFLQQILLKFGMEEFQKLRFIISLFI
jgi:hypothetical protein